MRTFSIHRARNVLAFAVVGVLFGVIYFVNPSFLKTSEVKAVTSQQNVSGWAWSSNVGWISFNSLDCDTDGNGFTDTGGCGGDNVTTIVREYGVNVYLTNKETGGTNIFSGYAWSSNVGWISFYQSDLSICPAGATVAQVDWSTGNVSGWARALAGNTTSGWDGCISLSGNATDGSPYGVTIDTTTLSFSGYAWGADVIGWIDFAPTVNGSPIVNNAKISTAPVEPLPGAPTVTILANPTNVTTGGKSVIGWSSTNTISCAATTPSGWTTSIATSGTQDVYPSISTTYSISCLGTDGITPAFGSVVVTVNTVNPAYSVSIGSTLVDSVYNISWITYGFTPAVNCSSSGATPSSSWMVPDPTSGTVGIQPVATPSVTTNYPIICTEGDNSASNSTTITIGTPSCNNNGVCEASYNENTVSCPHDCAEIGGTGTR